MKAPKPKSTAEEWREARAAVRKANQSLDFLEAMLLAGPAGAGIPDILESFRKIFPGL